MRAARFSPTEWLRAMLTPNREQAPSEEEQLSDLWGVERCNCCGRTLLLGETSLHVDVEGQPVVLCSACSAQAKIDTYRRAA